MIIAGTSREDPCICMITAGTLHEDKCICMIILLCILLRMINVLDRKCRDNQNTHFVII